MVSCNAWKCNRVIYYDYISLRPSEDSVTVAAKTIHVRAQYKINR